MSKSLQVLLGAAGVAFGLLAGCYQSHGVESLICPEFEPVREPVLIFASVPSGNVVVPAGVEGVRVNAFSALNVSPQDASLGIFPVTLRALEGSLWTADGPAIYDIRFTVNGLSTLYGPEAVPAGATTEAVVYLMEAWPIRAGRQYEYVLTVSFSPSARGRYEITLGEDCRLTAHAQFEDFEGDHPEIELDIPLELLGNNVPITRLVSVTP